LTLVVALTSLLWLLFPLNSNAQQLVDLTAEIDYTSWSYHFYVDSLPHAETNPPTIFQKNQIVHCVVGTNGWFMESDAWLFNGKEQYWFTGTNVIELGEITRSHKDDGGSLPPAGQQLVDVDQSLDGNPGRPIRVADIFTLPTQIPWLAFCSGSALKSNGRHLYPLSDIWKQTINAPTGFSDQTTVFKDALGLPIDMKLFAQTSQPIFQYQVHQTTNVMGWNFPLEFYMVQYEPDGANSWMVSFTARGRITAIGPGTKPQIPESVLKAVK
jgi:hypothetical protein